MFTCIYMGSDAIVKVWVWEDAQQLCEPECRRSDLEKRVWWMEISLVQQRHLTMVGKCNMGASTTVWMPFHSHSCSSCWRKKGLSVFVFFVFFQGIKNEFHYVSLFIPNNGFRLHSTHIKSKFRIHMIQQHGTKQNRIIVLQVAY